MTRDTGLAPYADEIVRLAGNRVSHAEIGRRIAERQGRRMPYQAGSIAAFLRLLKSQRRFAETTVPAQEPAP